jgi:uncharacterized FAD-dependent dehydrogenase
MRISDIRVPVGFPEENLLSKVLFIIGIPRDEVEHFSISRRGMDARRKGAIRRVYAVDVSLRSPALEEAVCSRVASARLRLPAPDPFPRAAVPPPSVRPVVVGAGPAGLFAALTLARSGALPILLERGRPVEERSRQVAAFWKEGALDPESNVPFGEGGAGTFSDGKLTTRIGDPMVEHVIGLFADFSGLRELSREARPHVGSDRLRRFCIRMREELKGLGAEVRFGARVDEIGTVGGSLRSVRLGTGEELPCEELVLAIGHSARDTVRMLLARGVRMTAKPFAVGFRVEHPQELIDRIQYGRMAGHPGLPAADYRLAVRAPSGRGVYSFCMCPGGEVMAASSGPGEMPVNGMSAHARNSGFANSGIVATVSTDDFGTGDVLAGVSLQKTLEARAFRKGGGGFGVPAMNLMAFLKGKDRNLSRGKALAPRVVRANLTGILPPRVEEDIRHGMEKIGESMRGFLSQRDTQGGSYPPRWTGSARRSASWRNSPARGRDRRCPR